MCLVVQWDVGGGRREERWAHILPPGVSTSNGSLLHTLCRSYNVVSFVSGIENYKLLVLWTVDLARVKMTQLHISDRLPLFNSPTVLF